MENNEKFIKKKYIKFYLGNKNIRSHIDAVHACSPKADLFTGEIVEKIVDKIDCSGIIAIVSRTKVDLNRRRNKNNKNGIDEYRQTIREILQHINILSEDGKISKPYLHLAIHGMRSIWKEDIEIGTLYGKTCSIEVKKWFINEIENYVDNVQIDQKFTGTLSLLSHRYGDVDSNYTGYGTKYNTLQIEISEKLRKYHREKLINMFCDIILKFNEKFK